MFEAIETVNEPPYCGLPSLSHQFPIVTVVVVLVVETGGFVVVVVVVVVFVVVVVLPGEVDIDVVGVVVLLQDAKTVDITIRQVSASQIAPFFIHTSFIFIKLMSKLSYICYGSQHIYFDMECYNLTSSVTSVFTFVKYWIVEVKLSSIKCVPNLLHQSA
jgi:hypothetical protein